MRFTLFEPEAGILRARDATQALAAQAVAAGAELRPRRGAARRRARCVLDDGRRLEADRVVWACGAWLPRAVRRRARPAHHPAGRLLLRRRRGAWRTPGVPGWVDYDGAAYGLGDLDGRGVKVAPGRRRARRATPRRVERVAVPEHERLARAYLAHRFPALADAPLVGHRALPVRDHAGHAASSIAPHPEHGGRVWLLGGGSGHGFKHGPALAERVEALADGRRGARAAASAWARARRDVGLRTAGVRTHL